MKDRMLREVRHGSSAWRIILMGELWITCLCVWWQPGSALYPSAKLESKGHLNIKSLSLFLSAAS